MVRIVELDDDLDVGIEVGPGTSNPEFGAVGLGADRVTQEVDKAPALPKRPPDIVALARGSRSFTSGSSSQRYEVSGHIVHAFLRRLTPRHMRTLLLRERGKNAIILYVFYLVYNL